MLLKLLEHVDRGKLVEGEVGGFFVRYPFHRDFEDLPRLAVGIFHGIDDENLPGLLVAQNQIKKNIPDTGPHIHSQDVGGQAVALLQPLNDGGPEPVIAPQDVAAAEDQD